MAEKERIERAVLWFEERLKSTPMPGAREMYKTALDALRSAADGAAVANGRWEWFEEWSPSTPDHPAECDACGWRCSKCRAALADIVGGYWDNPDEGPELNFCPNCGDRKDGGG